MNMNRVALNTREQELVNGGSMFNRESSIHAAGISLWKVYGQIPGKFGIFYNIGDYYFQGEQINQNQIDALEYYRDKKGEKAPSLEDAVELYEKRRKVVNKFVF